MHLLPGPCSATPAQQPLAVVQPPISKDDTHNDGAIARLDQSTKDHGDQILKIRGELNQMKEAIAKPQFAFVKRIRSPVVHIGSNVELANPPRRWRSKCGWSYGISNFLRVAEIVTPMRKCKKCFEMGSDSSSDKSDSDGSQVSDSSSSSYN